MKKICVSIFLILAVLATFVACGGIENDHNEGPGSNTEQTTASTENAKTVYDILNELSKIEYSQVHLNISTISGDVELKSSYTLTDSEITYSLEQLNLLPEDGNVGNLSSNYKATLKGSAVIENGKVTWLDGDKISIPSYDELIGAFNFDESNFRKIQQESGKLSAEVISASEFLGIDKNIKNMKITVEYSDSSLQKITITYNTDLSAVTTVYEYQK